MKKGNKKNKIARRPINAHLFENAGRSVPVMTPNGRKTDTTCCALAIYSFSDGISDAELDYFIKRQTEEAKLHWNPQSRSSGETCMAVVTVHPFEQRLERMLLDRGFKNAHDFSRRNGYPQIASCKLWVLNVKPIQIDLMNAVMADANYKCDDCGYDTRDWIDKNDHHGGVKRVCKDRNLCHGRGG